MLSLGDVDYTRFCVANVSMIAARIHHQPFEGSVAAQALGIAIVEFGGDVVVVRQLMYGWVNLTGKFRSADGGSRTAARRSCPPDPTRRLAVLCRYHLRLDTNAT